MVAVRPLDSVASFTLLVAEDDDRKEQMCGSSS
jgi:hypothetical protein